MQHELAGSSSDDRLTHRASDGDINACRSIVERYGAEVFRLAFLLSGDAPRSVELTADTLIVRLAALEIDAEQGDLREALLLELAARYLQTPATEAESATRIVSFPRESANRRFAVDDARSRLRHALDRLTATERAFVLLRLVGGVDGRRVTELTGLTDDRLDGLIDRLADVADVSSRQELSSTLVALGVEAPRVDLWELVEEPIADHLAARRRRARVLTAGIVVGALALVIGLTGSIVGNPWAGPSEPSDSAAAAGQETSIAEATEPAALPTVEIAPTATAAPVADVADDLIALQSRGVPEISRVSPDGSRSLTPVIDDAEGLLEANEPAISPDGERLATVWYRQRGSEVFGVVRLYDEDFSTLHWETEITEAVAPPASAGQQPFMLIPVVNRDVVWVAEHFWDRDDGVRLHALDLEDGSVVRSITTTLPGFIAHDIRLYAPPELDSVHLFTITREEPPITGRLQIVYEGYTIDGERLLSKTFTDMADSRIFFAYSARFTPDGGRLYGVEYTQARRELAVHFFDLRRHVIDRKVAVPFQPLADPLPFQHVTSHDGERLYILSHTTQEVGIVNLRERRLEALVPLDVSAADGPVGDTTYTVDGRMQLAPDGRHLYVIAPSRDGTSRPSGVWEIDTQTWEVTRRLAPDLEPLALLLSGDGETLYIREDAPSPLGETTTFSSLDLESGRLEVVAADLQGRLELTSPAQLYRSLYSRSPAVAGQVPANPLPGATLAGMELELSGSRIASGEHIDFEVQFIDPYSGEPATASDTLRYEPPASVQVMLEQQHTDRVVVVDLGPVGQARYGGTAQLNGDGWWTVRAVVSWPEGGPSSRVILRPEAVRVDAPPVVSQSLSIAADWLE